MSAPKECASALETETGGNSGEPSRTAELSGRATPGGAPRGPSIGRLEMELDAVMHAIRSCRGRIPEALWARGRELRRAIDTHTGKTKPFLLGGDGI